MFQGEDDFIKALKTNPDRTSMIDELFRNPDFLKVWSFLKNCPGVIITLKSTPGLEDKGGVKRFGWYRPGDHTLELNPTKPEHLSNPAELLDTLIHELIHALMDVRDRCDGEWPLPPGATDWFHDPDVNPPGALEPRKDSEGSASKDHAKNHYGDGASDPEHEYLDENDKAQEFIVKIVTAVLQNTGGGAPDFKLKGVPTLTFKGLKKLHGGPRKLVKNWQHIRAITWEPDACWQRTSTVRGWIMKCNCDSCIMVVKYDNGGTQIDLIDRGDKVEQDGHSLHVERLAGWDV